MDNSCKQQNYTSGLHLIGRWLICFILLVLQAPIVVSAGDTDAVNSSAVAVILGADDGLDVVSLDVYRQNNVSHLLAGVTRGADEAIEVLYLQSSDGRHWSAPVRVDSGMPSPHSPRRGKDMQIAGHGDNLIAIWSMQGDGFRGSGPMITARSVDGGMSWQQGANPADDGSTDGHDFIDIVSNDDGVFHSMWLDGRHGQQGVHYAYSEDSGDSWSVNETIDSMTCECCWNSLFISANSTLHAMYRDSRPRDLVVASKVVNGKWRGPEPVGKFDWSIEACPHNGGAIAEVRKPDQPSLHAVVWTGKQNAVGSYHLVSHDDGKKWHSARQLGNDQARHADLAASIDGKIVVVWEGNETGDNGTHIYTAASLDGGKNWSPANKLSSNNVLASHPRILNMDDNFSIFWTEKGQQGKQMLVTLVLQ